MRKLIWQNSVFRSKEPRAARRSGYHLILDAHPKGLFNLIRCENQVLLTYFHKSFCLENINFLLGNPICNWFTCSNKSNAWFSLYSTFGFLELILYWIAYIYKGRKSQWIGVYEVLKKVIPCRMCFATRSMRLVRLIGAMGFIRQVWTRGRTPPGIRAEANSKTMGWRCLPVQVSTLPHRDIVT